MDIKVWKNGFLVDAKAEIVCDTMVVTPVGEPTYTHEEWEMMMEALKGIRKKNNNKDK